MNTNNAIVIFIVLVVVIAIGYLLTINMNNRDDMINKGHHTDEMVKDFEIYPSDVADKIKNNKDIILLDVRTPEEYKKMHLKGSILLPVQELSQQTLESIGLGKDSKDKEIIIYCRSGARSKTAYDIMNSLGYTNIKSVAGGMVHWEEDNYPFTESGVYKGDVINDKTDTIIEGAKISFDHTSHDFGIIPQYNGVVKTTFVVKNEGTEDLIIGDITTSCSCTSATIASTRIAPGKESILTVTFDPNFHKEPNDVFKRTVFIPTNDKTTPEAEVVIQVDINEEK
ncbi:MAG TPA: DUF1573 domain-containing protein [Candidatus Kaiserbacteria bacterium]|nr:DUF1573 domain-containing protein [Candidatus Kaiserbacteria bacterium]